LITRDLRRAGEARGAASGRALADQYRRCAIFASVTARHRDRGDAIGGVALPQLLSRGYNRRWRPGSLAAGGTLAY